MGPKLLIWVALATLGITATTSFAEENIETSRIRHFEKRKWDKFPRIYQHPQERHLVNVEENDSLESEKVHVQPRLKLHPPAEVKVQEAPSTTTPLKQHLNLLFVPHMKPSKKGLKSKNSIRSGPYEKIVQFRLSAKRLPRKDKVSKTDPFVVVTYSDDIHPKPVSLGQTSVSNTSYIRNNENPNWHHIFTIKYDKTKNQRLHFVLLDKDFHGKNELIGTVSTKLKYYLDHGESLELPIETVDSNKEQNGYFPMLKIERI